MIYFDQVAITGHLNFSEAEFNGPINMRFAKLGTNLQIGGAQFKSRYQNDHINTFNTMQVGGHIMIRNCTFSAPAEFNYSKIANNFELTNSVFLFDSSVANSLETPVSSLECGGMKISGSAIFRGTSIKGSYYLGGMEYNQIARVPWLPADQRDSGYKELLNFVDGAEYSADTYKQLEDFFVRAGYNNWAERTFIRFKQRERRETLKWYWPNC